MTSQTVVADAPTAVPRPPRRRRGAVVGVVVVLLAVLAAAAWWSTRPRVEDPAGVARALAATWRDDGLAGVTFAPEPTAPAPVDIEGLTAALDAAPPAVRLLGVADVGDDELTTTARLAVDWTLDGGRRWSYETTATLVRAPEELTWAVTWDPRLVHPELTVGEHLEVGRATAERGEVVDARGRTLVGPVRVTRVGLHPARIDDLDEVVDTLVTALDDELDVELDGDRVRADVEAADPDHFVPVVVLRNDDYRRVEPVLYPLPGTTFRDDVLQLGPTRDFATFTLGSVGPVTAEQLEESPGRWEPGDLAGRSGLQSALDEVLSGTPGWSIVAVPDDDPGGVDGTDPDAVLHEVAPVTGADVAVTLDRRVQHLAQRAIADVETPAALAVVRPSDGAVLALANSPAATFDIARQGQLPPGSIFKVVTAGALLQDAGVSPDTPVGCPNTIEVGDRTISNAGTLALGDTTFAQGFANSCNTVFIALSEQLGQGDLATAATRFGIGEDVDWPLGMPAFTGVVPTTRDRTDQALTSFGQGRTLVNPLGLATVMATVADGRRVLPRLVLDPAAPGDGVEADGGDDGGDGADPMTPDVVADLQDLTRLVVTDGSGSAVEDLPGPPVHGKTGTADFTDADGELSQHVWFAGYRGDLAFALVVTEAPGGSGGGTAAPLVRDFLERFAAS